MSARLVHSIKIDASSSNDRQPLDVTCSGITFDYIEYISIPFNIGVSGLSVNDNVVQQSTIRIAKGGSAICLAREYESGNSGYANTTSCIPVTVSSSSIRFDISGLGNDPKFILKGVCNFYKYNS